MPKRTAERVPTDPAAAPAHTSADARYEQLVRTTPQTIFALDAEGRFTELNPAGEALVGRPAAELLGRRFDAVFDPADLAVAEEAFARLMTGAEDIVEVEVHITRPTGERRLVHVRGGAVRQDGRPVGTHGVARDITEMREAERGLQIANARLAQILATSPTILYTLRVQPNGRPVPLWVSDNIAIILGYEPAEALRPDWWSDRLHPDDAGVARDAERITESGAVSREYRFRDGHGTWRWIHDEQRLVTATEIVGSWTDVTERRAAEAALAAAELHYRRLVENSPYGIYVLDRDGRFIEINQAGLEILGRTADQVIGRSFADVILPEDMPKAAESLRRRLAGETDISNVELRVVRPSGESRMLHIRAVAITDEAGSVTGTHGVARDITEDVRNQQQLRRAERLATVGTLIGGVAHELNNPLQAINNFAALLLEDAHTEQEREDLETIRREAARAAKIVADLRLLARDTQDVLGQRTSVDLNDIVRHVLRTRGYALAVRNIVVRADLAGDLPPVSADRGDIEQVLINLIVNAEQAMDAVADSRRLIIRTRATGTGVALHVVDTGPGIPRAHLDQIFDPFFTTKPRNEGTGLGLSLVHKIITEHGGEIYAESELGNGAAFHIHLPVAADIAVDAGAVADARLRTAVTPLRILIVEDEAAIRSAVSRFLKRRGHAVDVAVEGGEALRLLESGREYDAILSDLRMPGLGGDQLLARLREAGTGLDRRVIFLTGEAASGEAARVLAEVGAPVIYKPIELRALAQRIEERVAELGTR
ncbi:MAG TPA: PAS domain S-box protein [Longimicrobiales bacterium]